MIGGGMKNIWDGGVSSTIGSGRVKLFHYSKFSVEHILYMIPGGNDVKKSFASFERDSK